MGRTTTAGPTVASAPGGSRAGKMRLPNTGTSLGGPDMEHATALWLLVALELAALVGMRHYFRRHHGG